MAATCQQVSSASFFRFGIKSYLACMLMWCSTQAEQEPGLVDVGWKWSIYLGVYGWEVASQLRRKHWSMYEHRKCPPPIPLVRRPECPFEVRSKYELNVVRANLGRRINRYVRICTRRWAVFTSMVEPRLGVSNHGTPVANVAGKALERGRTSKDPLQTSCAAGCCRFWHQIFWPRRATLDFGAQAAEPTFSAAVEIENLHPCILDHIEHTARL